MFGSVSDSERRREQAKAAVVSNFRDSSSAPGESRKPRGGQRRRTSMRVWATWRGIVARAESALVVGDELVVVVPAVGALSDKLQAHDEFHAQITAMVFSEQAPFQSLPRTRAFLKDESGVKTEVRVNTGELKLITDEFLSSHGDGRQADIPIPAPLVRFLLLQKETHS